TPAPPWVPQDCCLARCADLEDLRPADRADALGRGPAVLHRDLLRILDLTRGLALHAISGGQRCTSQRWGTAASYPRPSARLLARMNHKTPLFRAGSRGEEGRVGISSYRRPRVQIPCQPLGRLPA